ncbi:MAG: SIR2 family protein [Rhodospirillaceae bacterium]|nr:SIR2 family protein [Rhodospirillaceae bacterium]
MNSSEASVLLDTWHAGLGSGRIVPILGPDSQDGCTDVDTGESLPVQGNDLILAMNDGKPMSPKLMTDFSRAAMNLEFKRGRKFINRFLTELYEARRWSVSPQMRWIATAQPRYVVDLNRDSVLPKLFADRAHVLIQGVARLSRADPRYRAFRHDAKDYVPLDEAVEAEALASGGLPILFKPLGCAQPRESYIASDADFVDFLTEMMGGFALPPFLKTYRKGKQYLIAGVRLKKDTERMIVRDLVYDADPHAAGWLVAENPTPKECRFAGQMGLTVIDAPLTAFWS